MKNWKLNITLLVVFYLIFLLVNVPAALVVDKLTLPKDIKLGQVSGSLWNGQVAAVRYKTDVIDNATWQLSPLSLLTGSVSAYVKFGKVRDAESISGVGDISTNFAFDKFSADDFTLRYPANQLVQKMRLGLPMQVSGKVNLKLNEYVSAKPYCEALNGTVSWTKATVKGLQGNIDLGKLDGELACKDGAVELKVTKANPLGLQMTSLLGANNKFTVNGFVKPNGDMPTEVHNAVQLLGRADSQGRFPLNF